MIAADREIVSVVCNNPANLFCLNLRSLLQMKKYLNLATALIASLKPKSKIPIIDTYGESTLNQDEQQALMEWLFASLMGTTGV
jgi:hypothetical protein